VCGKPPHQLFWTIPATFRTAGEQYRPEKKKNPREKNYFGGKKSVHSPDAPLKGPTRPKPHNCWASFWGPKQACKALEGRKVVLGQGDSNMRHKKQSLQGEKRPFLSKKVAYEQTQMARLVVVWVCVVVAVPMATLGLLWVALVAWAARAEPGQPWRNNTCNQNTNWE
jgi:hypothetical protein